MHSLRVVDPRWLVAMVAASAGLLGCGPPVEATGTEVEGPEVEVDTAEQALLGGIVFGAGCSTLQQQYLKQWAFVTRTVLPSAAFKHCLELKMQSYIPCVGDPQASSSAADLVNALLAATNVNKVALSCDTDAGPGIASADVGVFAHYGQDIVTYHNWLTSVVGQVNSLSNGTDDVGRFLPYPWPLTQGAEGIAHEAIHQQGYAHWDHPAVTYCTPESGVTTITCSSDANCTSPNRCVKAPGAAQGKCATYDQFVNAVPFMVGQCVKSMIGDSQQVCGTGLCPTRVNDDLDTCMTRGSVQLMTQFNVPPVGTPCKPHFDPSRSGAGLIRFENSVLRTSERVPHGVRFSNRWNNGVGDFVIQPPGDLWPTEGGQEIVLRSGWGLGVISTSQSAMKTVAMSPFGTALSHWGDGTGVWTIQGSDSFGRVGRFSSQAQYTAGGAGQTVRDEIFVRKSNAIGILAVVDGVLKTRFTATVPSSFTGPYGNWVLGSDMSAAFGDFNGDGQTDVLVRSPWGYGVLSHTGASGAMVTLDMRPFGERWGGWLIGTGDTIVQHTGDFNSDGRTDFFVQSGWGIGLIGIPPGETRLRTLWSAPYGTLINGQWTLTNNDQLVAVGKFEYLGPTAVILRGSQGVAVMSFGITSAPTVTISEKKPYGSSYSGSSPGVGAWNLGGTDIIVSDAVGDFDGDGLDNLVVRSAWGFGILGEKMPTSTTFVSHAVAPYNCGPNGCHGGLLGDWLTKSTNLVVTAVKADSGATYLMLRD